MLRRLFGEADDPAAPGAVRGPRRLLLRFLGWFGVANIPAVAAVGLRNLAVSDSPVGLLPRLFGTLMFVGHSAVVAFIPMLLLIPLLPVWPRRRLVVPLAALLSGVTVAVVAIDTVIYNQYRFHLNAEIFNLLFGGAAGEILIFTTTMYLQITAVVLIILGGETLAARVVWRRVLSHPGRLAGYAVTALLVATFLAQSMIHAWADVVGYTPVTRQTRVLLGYLPTTAESFMRKMGVDVERADAVIRTRDPGSSLNYPLEPLRCEPPASPPNVLFVVIDGWRFDALTEAATPNIERLARRGLQFTDHLAGGSGTRTGLFSLFYGIPGTYWRAVLAERRGPVFVSHLLDRNYQVQIFGSATLVNPEFDRTAFVDVPDLRLYSDGRRPSERDADLTEDFLSFLEQRDSARPFLSMLFYDAPHGYDVPDDHPQPFQPSLDEVNFLALNPDFDPEPFHNRYLNCIHFDDSLFGRALAALERHELLDNTLLIITGDHGQEFNENGLNYWGHDANFSRYQVAVPLVVVWPGRQPAVYDHRTTHFDVVPTLMRDVFNCSNDPADYSVGRNLFEPGGRDVLLLANYIDYAIVQPGRINAVYPYGVEVLDDRYRPIPDAKPDRSVMLEALRLRSRFYR